MRESHPAEQSTACSDLTRRFLRMVLPLPPEPVVLTQPGDVEEPREPVEEAELVHRFVRYSKARLMLFIMPGILQVNVTLQFNTIL